jgi:hypothetical protein
MANGSILDVNKILDAYAKDIARDVTTDAEIVAKQGVTELKNTTGTYRVRTGKYNRGWRVKTDKMKNGGTSIIYNATDYQLTHLLEHGHDIVGRDGTKKGRARAFVHIKPVEQKCIEEYERLIEKDIGG